MSDDGWIEIVRRYRLWSDVQEHERVTDEIIRKSRYGGSAYTDAEILNLHNPSCIVALKHARHGGRWAPCNQPVKAGADRCKHHGGPSSAATAQKEVGPTKAQLLVEVEALRALVGGTK